MSGALAQARPQGTPPSSGSLGPQPGRLGRGAEGRPSPAHRRHRSARDQGRWAPRTCARGEGAVCKAAPGRPLILPSRGPNTRSCRPEPQERLREGGTRPPPKGEERGGRSAVPDGREGTGTGSRCPEAEDPLAGRPECSGSSGKAPAQDHRESRASSSPEKPAGQGRSGRASDTSVLRLPDFLPGPVGQSAPWPQSFREAAGRAGRAAPFGARPPVPVAPGPPL